MTPKHAHPGYSQRSFYISTWKRGGVVWMCKLGKELNANNDKLVVRR